MKSTEPRKLLFTISSYAYLEPLFLASGELERAEVDRKTFPDGERYLRLAADTWGRDVVLLGGTPTDLDWLEVYDLAFAITRGGARSLSIVMPYFGYSTMERAVKPGEVVTAKTRAMLISAIPPCEAGTRLFLFDLHTDGIEFYFGERHITRHIYEPAFVYKQRDSSTGALQMTGINADVKGREIVIYDDMIRTGSTLVQAGRAYLEAGATKVHAIASHLVLPGSSLETIQNAGVFTTILGTNSHPGSQKLAAGNVASVADLLMQALVRPR
ncbi:MAG: ribose-phosphate pyrophosphokinase-like domain-containing protein [Polyangiaceae bacterium]|nr:ribose-phosphate pyrophosphokinase-like domain-containing protein [Polyangiaceae bacterium]